MGAHPNPGGHPPPPLGDSTRTDPWVSWIGSVRSEMPSVGPVRDGVGRVVVKALAEEDARDVPLAGPPSVRPDERRRVTAAQTGTGSGPARRFRIARSQASAVATGAQKRMRTSGARRANVCRSKAHGGPFGGALAGASRLPLRAEGSLSSTRAAASGADRSTPSGPSARADVCRSKAQGGPFEGARADGDKVRPAPRRRDPREARGRGADRRDPVGEAPPRRRDPREARLRPPRPEAYRIARRPRLRRAGLPFVTVPRLDANRPRSRSTLSPGAGPATAKRLRPTRAPQKTRRIASRRRATTRPSRQARRFPGPPPRQGWPPRTGTGVPDSPACDAPSPSRGRRP